MNKLLSTLLAGVAVMAFTTGAYAAEDKARDSGKDVQNQTQGAPVDQAGKDVAAEGREAPRDPSAADSSGTVNEGNKSVATEGRDPKKEEFQAEMKKCEAMTGAQKKTCSDAAKKKYGQM